MKPKFYFLVFISLLLTTSFATIDYTGDNLLLLLATSTTSKEFKTIKEFWLLDKNLQNEYGGIKLSANSITGKIESVLITGENFQLSGTKFLKCSSPLPFNILLSDDTSALRIKLGDAQKLIGRNTMKYYVSDIAIEIAYTDLRNGKISSVKFYKEIKPTPKPVVVGQATSNSAVKIKLEERRIALEQKTFIPSEVKAEKVESVSSPFKKALLNVFKSYKESNFYSIKNGLRNSNNFWNYQFTYTTKLKIPGEKFNMLYSFPFTTSPLDFVSVIKEGDNYDASFLATYKELEKKLMQNFPDSEGWTSACIPNKESKALSDLEFSNDKYGSIILDYSVTPKGKHILYLRFLLYSN